MTDYHGILFSGSNSPGNEQYYSRGLGPYRLRTVMAQRGYRIKVIDFCEVFEVEDIVLLIRRYVTRGTKFLAVSNTFMTPELVAKILDPEILREAESLAGAKLTVISGGARTLRFRLPQIDWYVSGYADESFPALADFISGKSNQIQFREMDGIKHIDSNHSYPVKDTSDLTTIWLAEDLIRKHEALPIEIARGCIFRCSFCAFPLNGKKKFDYIRNPENLLSEMRRNREMFGTTQYGFMDDTYNDSEFKMELMHKALTSLEFKIRYLAYIKPELLNTWPHHTEMLAESGLLGATMGFETFHYKARQAVRKGANLEGIIRTVEKLHRDSGNQVGVEGTFIAGLPHETVESLLSTHEWLKKNTHIIQAPSWNRLYINQKTVGAYMSDMDKNPESFGYQVSDGGQWGSLDWKSKTLTSELAFWLSHYFMKDMASRSLFSGWSLANLSHIPGLDLQEMVATRTSFKHGIDYKFMYESRVLFMRKYFETQLSGGLNQPDFVPWLKAAADL